VSVRQCMGDRRVAAGPQAGYEPAETLYPADALYGLIPRTTRRRLPIYELLARLLDGSEFDEFKPLYGPTLVCGTGRIWGEAVGIIANNGVMFGESAQKGAHFVQLCDRQGIPRLFLHDIVGFLVGKGYEHRGVAKGGAKVGK